MNKLYAIGELIIDFQSKGLGSLKDTTEFVKNAGGACANVCVQASNFGIPTVYLSKVGADGFGQFLIESLKLKGVDTSHIVTTSLYDTSLAFVSFQADGEREFSFFRKKAADLYFSDDDFKDITFAKGDILEFGSVALATNEGRKKHLELIKKASSSKALIAFDPNLRFNLWSDANELKMVVKEYARYANIMKIGSDELEFVYGKSEEQVAKELFAENLEILLVTYGAKGASVYLKNGEKYSHPGFKVKAIDTTGAGDSCFGAFLALIIEKGIANVDYKKALEMACRAGAYTITKYGAIKAMGTKEEILEGVK